MTCWVKPLALAAALCAVAVAPARADRNAPELLVTAQEVAELDELAMKWLRAVQQRSIRQNLEYCAFIYRDSAGNFTADKPRPGHEDGCSLIIRNQNAEAVASFHTHSSYSPLADSEVPSVLDLQSDIDEGMVGYIATPAGRFWRTNFPAGSAVQLCGPGCLPTDPDHVYGDYGKVLNRYTIGQLRRRQGEAPRLR